MVHQYYIQGAKAQPLHRLTKAVAHGFYIRGIYRAAFEHRRFGDNRKFTELLQATAEYSLAGPVTGRRIKRRNAASTGPFQNLAALSFGELAPRVGGAIGQPKLRSSKNKTRKMVGNRADETNSVQPLVDYYLRSQNDRKVR